MGIGMTNGLGKAGWYAKKAYDDVRKIIDAIDGQTALKPATPSQDGYMTKEYAGRLEGINSALYILSRNTSYAVGDIAYSPKLPSYLRLETVVPGTTGTTEPDFSGASTGGGIIVDGGCTFIIDDVRDGTPVGQVRASMYLPAGYVKLEGGTVNRSNYPRLVALADTYSLWTDDPTANPGLFGEGDGSTTMILPNWTGRMAQFAATAGGKVDAGLPNVTGEIEDNSTNGNNYSAGALYVTVWDQVSTYSRTSSNRGRYLHFDASLSNPIYSASQTVQPAAINTFAIMRY